MLMMEHTGGYNNLAVCFGSLGEDESYALSYKVIKKGVETEP